MDDKGSSTSKEDKNRVLEDIRKYIKMHNEIMALNDDSIHEELRKLDELNELEEETLRMRSRDILKKEIERSYNIASYIDRMSKMNKDLYEKLSHKYMRLLLLLGGSILACFSLAYFSLVFKNYQIPYWEYFIGGGVALSSLLVFKLIDVFNDRKIIRSGIRDEEAFYKQNESMKETLLNAYKGISIGLQNK